MKIIVFFSGTGTNLRSFLEQENDLNYEVVSTFTNNPKAGGIKIASEFNKPCKIIDHRDYDERKIFDQKIQNYLDGIDFDYIVLAGYMRILSSFLVEAYEGQIINIHPSLLPKYPGLDTHNRALASNDTHHGTTIHFVINELDSGPIIRQESFAIEPNDTSESLIRKVKDIENDIYPKTVSKYLT
ncbi:phosphoribosylglycinamide formyltransferase [Gammaproteobacteria bacterium]|nr:phosphoribosylglycinamide formyltransferase [Gammaproteobacteria bacterium]